MLKDEIKKRKPFDDPAEEAYLNLLRTAAVLGTDFERLFKAAGLSEPQYNVLRILRGAPDHRLPTLEIASRMITRAPNITRLIDKLVRKKFVSRCDHDRDRRVVVVQLTPGGLDLVNGISAAINNLDVRGLDALSKTQVATLIEILDAVRSEPGERR